MALADAKKEAAALNKQLKEWAEAYYTKDSPVVKIMSMTKSITGS